MGLNDFVTLTISQDNTGVARAGFGVPMILGYSATFPERLRYYSDITSVGADVPATSPEFRAARAALSQTPHPTKIAIGKGLNKPQLTYVIGVAAVRNSHVYSLNVEGQGITPATVTGTSDGTATNDEVTALVVAALNGVAARNFTAEATGSATAMVATVMGDASITINATTFTVNTGTDEATATAHGLTTGDGPIQTTNSGGGLPAGLAVLTNYWVIVTGVNTFKLATSRANALANTAVDLTTAGTGTQTYTGNSARTLVPGAWFSLEVVDVADLTNKMTHADPGLAADLDAIKLYDDNWYAVQTSFNSKPCVEGVAAWAEPLSKIYVTAVPETEAINTADQSTPDTAHDTGQAIQALAYAHTAVAYHPSPAGMFDAAWEGDVLPLDAGSETWALKTLSGVAPANLTQTQHDNLVARNMSGYYTRGARNITFGGTVGDGNFIDVIRGLHWLEDDMTKAVFGVLAGAPTKVAFTDNGIQQIAAAVRGSLKRAVAQGIISADFTLIVPKIADVSDADKAARRLPGIKFLAVLQGAIHSVSIVGVVSV